VVVHLRAGMPHDREVARGDGGVGRLRAHAASVCDWKRGFARAKLPG
jgi:hypothetical protein